MNRPLISIVNSSTFGKHFKEHISTLEKFSDIQHVTVAADIDADALAQKIKNYSGRRKRMCIISKAAGNLISIELPFAFAGKLKKELSKLLVKPVQTTETKVISLKQSSPGKAAAKKPARKVRTKNKA